MYNFKLSSKRDFILYMKKERKYGDTGWADSLLGGLVRFSSMTLSAMFSPAAIWWTTLWLSWRSSIRRELEIAAIPSRATRNIATRKFIIFHTFQLPPPALPLGSLRGGGERGSSSSRDLSRSQHSASLLRGIGTGLPPAIVSMISDDDRKRRRWWWGWRTVRRRFSLFLSLSLSLESCSFHFPKFMVRWEEGLFLYTSRESMDKFEFEKEWNDSPNCHDE